MAIQSILDQDNGDWELIVVDDASSDGTYGVCEAYAREDSRIRVIRHEINRGVSAARNTGLARASGEYVLFLDDDNGFALQTLSRLDEYALKDGPDLAVFNMRAEGVGDLAGRMLDRSFIRETILPEHIDIRPHGDLYLQPFSWNKCFKRSVLEEHHLQFDPNRRTWEDNKFVVDFLDVAESIVLWPEMMLQYNTDGSADHLSSHFPPEVLGQWIETFEENCEKFGGEYDCRNGYTARYYFDIAHRLMVDIGKECSSEVYRETLAMALHHPVMRQWVDQIELRAPWEARVRAAFDEQDEEALFKIYENWTEPSVSIATRIRNRLSRVKNMLKKTKEA